MRPPARRSTGCATRRRRSRATMWWTRTAACCAWCPRSGAPGTPACRTGAASTALNDRSIGIEIVNPGHELGYRDFPVLQLASVCDLCLEILSRHAVPARNIVGHSDVAPDRKRRPGGKIRLGGAGAQRRRAVAGGRARPRHRRRGARRGVAARRAGGAGAISATRWRRKGALDPALAAVLRAFQRHWRPEAVTGQADAGTLARLLAVARLP